MLTRILFFLIVILPLPLATAETLPRVAIVTDGNPKTDELLVLVEMELFQLRDIELLERAEIEKVLAEQQLAGLCGATNAVELGRILKTDLYAVLETTSIVVFDAKTGLRFVDITLEEEALSGKPDDTVKIVCDAVKTAVEKRKKLGDHKLLTFAILEVRNADFPIERDAWCCAVAGMLERSLLHRGGAVLERSRLQLVTRERGLTGDTTNDLLTSMKLIDLEFTRGDASKSFKITARIDNETYPIETPIDEPLDAVRKIAEKLLDHCLEEKTKNKKNSSINSKNRISMPR